MSAWIYIKSLHSVGPDLTPIGLQRLSADGKIRCLQAKTLKAVMFMSREVLVYLNLIHFQIVLLEMNQIGFQIIDVSKPRPECHSKVT